MGAGKPSRERDVEGKANEVPKTLDESGEEGPSRSYSAVLDSVARPIVIVVFVEARDTPEADRMGKACVRESESRDEAMEVVVGSVDNVQILPLEAVSCCPSDSSKGVPSTGTVEPSARTPNRRATAGPSPYESRAGSTPRRC